LLEFAARVTAAENGDEALCAVLTADITVADWTPLAIGRPAENPTNDSPNPYTGTFDGAGHSLSLTKTTATTTSASGESGIALFHTIGTDGVVKNLALNVNFSGNTYIAGVAVKNYGTIDHITVDGYVESSMIARCFIAGIAAWNGCKTIADVVVPGKILYCVNKAEIGTTRFAASGKLAGLRSGGSQLGGICGSFLGEMRYCANLGDIWTASNDSSAGSGSLFSLRAELSPNEPVQKLIVSDCYNAGTVFSIGTSGGVWNGGILGGSMTYILPWESVGALNISNVFNYGVIKDPNAVSISYNGNKFSGFVIIGGATSESVTEFHIEAIFANVYYRPEVGGAVFGISDLNGTDGYGSNRVKNVIKSKTTAEFASADMAALLNNGRTGDAALWEFVEGNDYPTFKWADGTGDDGTDGIESPAEVDVVAVYGGSITYNNGSETYTVSPTVDDYLIDAIWVDGVQLENVHGLATYTTTAGQKPSRSIVASFAYTVNFNNPAHGSLSVSRGDVNLTSGSIVRAGETLKVTAAPDSGYTSSITLDGLTRIRNTDEYTVTAARTAPPTITAAFTVKSSGGEATEPDTSEPDPGDNDDEPATDEPTTEEPPAAEDGWIQNDDGEWEYLTSGEAETGWLYDTTYKAWYYLAESGTMQTGWEYTGGSWYYLAGNGKMKTGWVRTDGNWYYLRGSGAMVAAKWFHDTDGSWYYLSGNGKMLTGKQKLGGKTYTFKSSGVWIS
jgi:hypothetical protein